MAAVTVGSLHELSYESVPIADGWLVECSCGWHQMVSDRMLTKEQTFAELKRLGVVHAQNVVSTTEG